MARPECGNVDGVSTTAQYGERAQDIRLAVIRRYGSEDKITAVQKCRKGEHMKGGVETVRVLLKNLEKQGGKVGIAARLLSSSAATVAEVIRFLASPAERKRYARDVQAYPASSRAEQNYCDRLKTALGMGCAQDIATAAVRAVGDCLGRLGKDASSKFLKLLSVVASNPAARAAVAALLVLFLATAYAYTAGTATMGTTSVEGLTTLAIEIAATEAGTAVAAIAGGTIPLLLAVGVAFAVSWAGRKVYKAVCDARSSHLWWDGFLRSLGIRSGGSPQRPSWVVPAALDDSISAEARDLLDPCTMELMTEPTILRGRIYERGFIEKWVEDNGSDPYQRDEVVGIGDLRPCPEMRALVVEFANTHGLKVAVHETCGATSDDGP